MNTKSRFTFTLITDGQISGFMMKKLKARITDACDELFDIEEGNIFLPHFSFEEVDDEIWQEHQALCQNRPKPHRDLKLEELAYVGQGQFHCGPYEILVDLDSSTYHLHYVEKGVLKSIMTGTKEEVMKEFNDLLWGRKMSEFNGWN